MRNFIVGLVAILIIAGLSFAGSKYYDWTTNEVITAPRLNMPWDSTTGGIAATQVTQITLPDNNATAFDIKENVTSYMKFVTTNGSETIVAGKKISSEAGLIASDIRAVSDTTNLILSGGLSSTGGYILLGGADSSNGKQIRFITDTADRMTIGPTGLTTIKGAVSFESTIRTNQSTTAPSDTQTVKKWLLININGADYKIPTYQ